MIRLKPNTSLDNVHPRVYEAISLAAVVWAVFGSPDLWVTGGNEGGHSTGPRGYHRLPDGTCRAVDLRTWTIPVRENRLMACRVLAAMLGPLFDVLFEEEIRDATGKITRGEHAHVQYDEDRPGTRA